MKTIFICSPSIGDFNTNLALADSIGQIAVNQGHFPVIGSPMLPGQETLEELQETQLRQCDEVWLYYDGQKLRRDMLTDLQRAARAGKPVRLVQRETLAQSWPVAADSYFAADSYADAPGCDDAVEAEIVPDPSLEFAAEPVRISGLLLALKQLEELLEFPIPGDWWAEAVHPKEDYLLEFGVGQFLKVVEALIRRDLLPPWPGAVPAELNALKELWDAWDWPTELPDLDRDRLALVGQNDWHKLGYIFQLRGDYERAFAFLDKALTDNPRNYLVWSEIGECLFHLGHFDLAKEAFETALAVAPRHYYAWVGLGRALAAVGRHSEAITAFDQALACKGGQIDLYVSELRTKALNACSHMFN